MKPEEEIPGVNNDYSGLTAEESFARYKQNMDLINAHFEKKRRVGEMIYRGTLAVIIITAIAAVVFLILGPILAHGH